MKQPIEAFLDHFSTLEDVREPGKVLHPLPEILLVTLCGVMAYGPETQTHSLGPHVTFVTSA